MTKPMVFLGNGRGGFNRQDAGANVYALDKWHFYTGDFNGDGKKISSALQIGIKAIGMDINYFNA